MRLRAWRTLNSLRLTRTRIHIVLRPRHTRASVLSSFPYKSSFVHARADNINFLFSVSPFCLRGKAAREGTATRKVSRPGKPDRAKKREGKVRRWLERRQMLCGGKKKIQDHRRLTPKKLQKQQQVPTFEIDCDGREGRFFRDHDVQE